MENEKQIRYFSMFTGVGGFELGLEDSDRGEFISKQTRGRKHLQSKRDKSNNKVQWTKTKFKEFKSQDYCFKCVGFSEIDKYASELLKQKFPNIKNYGDATKIKPNELPDFDMLCGGFPCQAFSIAGKRRGFKDTRGTLFFDIARILEVKRPKIVFLENVKGLLNHEKGKTFFVILQTLEELGYEVQWMVLNSKFFGVPQNRERVFIIGSLRGECKPEILPLSRINQQIIKQSPETILDVNQAQRVYSTEGTSITLKGLGGGQGAKTGLYAVALRNLNRNGPIHNEENVFTLQQSQGCENGVMDNMKIRRLTPTECERLQGFPDGWTEGFSDTQRYKMMGNAVTVNVIKAIAERLFK